MNLSNLFLKLRQAFQGPLSGYDFNFTEEAEENTGTLEILYKINASGTGFVNAFKTILIKSFRQNPYEEFMGKVSQVTESKEVIFI